MIRLFEKESERKPRKAPVKRKTLGTLEEYNNWEAAEKAKAAAPKVVPPPPKAQHSRVPPLALPSNDAQSTAASSSHDRVSTTDAPPYPMA